MTDYSISQLKDISEEEAEQLPQEDYERWEELHDMLDEARENKDELVEQETQAVNTLVKAGENELTSSMQYGGLDLEIKMTMDERERELFQEINSISKSDVQGMEEEQLDKLIEKELELLDRWIVDQSKEHIEEFAEAHGPLGLAQLTVKIFLHIREEREDLMDGIEKFR